MRLLLLAGTAEAREIAEGLAARGQDALASLSGAVRVPRALPLPVRTGGFGGAEGFRRVLNEEGIGAVIDATHPFAARITERTVGLCAELGMPCLQVRRPPWEPGVGDDWHDMGSEEEVAEIVPPSATIFLATGPARLERFAGLAGRRVILRRIEAEEGAASSVLPGLETVIARPPFDFAAERRLFAEKGVDWLVTRNAGGGGTAKLSAARELGIPVAMIRRPMPPEGPRVATAQEALDWAAGL